MKFEDMKISEAVCKALREKEYDVATPIQAQAIPIVMEGTDVLGLAQTGTGKTAAFAIPIIEQLMNNFDEEKKQERRNIKALILTPTRELALQIDESFSDYGKYVPLRPPIR
jgi:ATP-dependent RNA helicase RhlE